MNNKVIWITGASSGIGEELAYALANVSAKLVLSGRDEDSLARIKRKCLSEYWKLNLVNLQKI